MRHTNTQNLNSDWTSTHYTDKEASLLAIIQENSRLPEREQTRYQLLWCKCENGTISDDELAEYQTLLSQLETCNLKRIEALMVLAQIKGKRYGKLLPDSN
jgi:hypothetical protein